jgi:hypothetical protein
MKKNMATAMAAAMAFGSVVPAFAAENQTRATVSYESLVGKTTTLDTYRLATGYKLYNDGELLTREEVYDYNGATASETSKHTLKEKFADMKMVYDNSASVNTVAEERYAFIQEIDVQNDAYLEAEADLKNLELKISAAKADGYSVYSDVISSGTGLNTAKTAYVGRTRTITLKKDGEANIVVEYKYVDDAATLTTVQKEYQATVALRKSIFGKTFSWTTTTSSLETVNKIDYYTVEKTVEKDEKVLINKMKYLIEANSADLTISKEEVRGNQDTKVTLYRKDAKKTSYNTVAIIIFKDTTGIDLESVYEIPSDNDFSKHWASSNILNAMMSGQVDASATFRPNASVTRAEFAKMICTVLGNVIDTTNGYDDDKTYDETFHDVVSGDWFRNYVAFLQENGIVQGDDEANFRPNETITKQDAALIISNILNKCNIDKLYGTSTDTNVTTAINNYGATMVDVDNDSKGDTYLSLTSTQKKLLVKNKIADAAKIGNWADHSVFDLVMNWEDENETAIITGDGTNFNPTSNITRAEALVMIQRASTAQKVDAPTYKGE